MYGIHGVQSFAILGEPAMRHLSKTEPITALKALLRNLEHTRLIYPDDINVLRLKRELKTRIDSLEKHKQPRVGKRETQATAAD